MEQKSFGQLLRDLNLVTEEQLEYALQLQREAEVPKTLGEILLEQRIIDAKTLKTIHNLQKRRGDVEADRARYVFSGNDITGELQGADAAGFLKVAKKCEASDLFLGANEKPSIRHHGHLIPLPAEDLSQADAERLLFELLTEEQIATLRQENSVDLCSMLPDVGRFRLHMFRHERGLSGVFRFIADAIWPFDKLGLPMTVQDLAKKRNGLVLITGPTNSGKSTTMASLVDYINRNFNRHIITIEDPIEVIHESKKSLVSQREVNLHTTSYAHALRAALREDPDVLVVGEMRDPETIGIAITAAETGHLVFGTLHTQTSYRTIVRILDQFPPEKRANVRTILAGTLRGVVCQQLVPTAHGNQRVLAYEVLIVNNAISHLILDDKIWQIPATMQMGHGEGMRLMDDALLGLVNTRAISREEALSRAVEKEKFAIFESAEGAYATH